MPLHFPSVHFLQYLLKRQATQFFVSIAIRRLALGMIMIFEPIFIYLYFGKSLPQTLLFFAATNGLYGLLIVFGGKVMGKIGLKHNMLLSHFFFFGYYICLFFLPRFFLLIPLAIILKAIGMALFWPAFHTDFIRFTEKSYRGRSVGKLNLAILIPAIISPILGGWILTSFGYPVLFTIVLVVLFASAIPLFLSKEAHVVYSDSYRTAWGRILKKKNRKMNLAFISNGIEYGISLYLWPIFMTILALGYGTMGGIATFSLGMAALFTLYMGRLSDRLINRIRFLNIGSILTSISWVLKYFVITPFTAFLAQTLYMICRTTAAVPYQAIFYGKASLKGAEADEFIIYRGIVFNIANSFFLMFLAGFFFFIPQVNLAFIMAAIISLGLMYLGIPVKFKKLRWKRKR